MHTQNAARSVWSEALVIKLLRDYPYFNVILDIHERQMPIMDVYKPEATGNGK